MDGVETQDRRFGFGRVLAGMRQDIALHWGLIVLSTVVLFVAPRLAERHLIPWESFGPAHQPFARVMDYGWWAIGVVATAYLAALILAAILTKAQGLRQLLAAATRNLPTLAVIALIFRAPDWLVEQARATALHATTGTLNLLVLVVVAAILTMALYIAERAFFGMAQAVAVRTGAGPVAALRTAWALSRGVRWRVAAVILGVEVVSGSLAWFVPYWLGDAGPERLYSWPLSDWLVAYSAIATPLLILFLAEMYREADRLRMRREGVDEIFV